jgi:hypothetical protein
MKVTVPGVGPVDREWVYAGGAAVAGIVAWAWWTRSRTSTVPAVDQTATETGTDQEADGYTNPAPSKSTVIDLTSGITTNSEWTAAVTDSLTNLGYDPATISSVLGKYLASQQVTETEAELIRTAWAYAGKPPEGPKSFTVKTGTSDTSTEKKTRKLAAVYVGKSGWSRTVWDIAAHYGVNSATVWMAPENATLRNLRKVQQNLMPGDIIYVPHY